MNITKPSEQQVQNACAILKSNKLTYGLSGAEGSDRRAVFSILAALTGVGAISEEYLNALTEAPVIDGEDLDQPSWFVVHPEGTLAEAIGMPYLIEVVGDNQWNIPFGTVYAPLNSIPNEDFDTLTISIFNDMNKEQLVAAYGKTHNLTMEMTRPEMQKALGL